MDANLQSKVTTLLTGCDTECQRLKELNKLKTEYEEYLQKYIQTYSEYQKIQYGQTLEEKKFQQEYEQKSKEFNNKMSYIENVLTSDIKQANDIITQQKKIIKEKNVMLGKGQSEIKKRKKILDGLTNDLITDKGQNDNFDDQLLKKISILPYGILKYITVNYVWSTYLLFILLLVILTVIIILIYKIIV